MAQYDCVSSCGMSRGMSRRLVMVCLGSALVATKLLADLRLMAHLYNPHQQRRQDQLHPPQPSKSWLSSLYSLFFRNDIMVSWDETASYLQSAVSGTDESGNALHYRYRNYTNTTNSDYAYAFVVGGCDPLRPVYRGFVYNILVATRILRSQGSTADIVVFMQLSWSAHRRGMYTLPLTDVRPLQHMGIHLYYIPPSIHESFYETVMNKFRILQLTQYRRVILMDGDVTPLGNLDYFFQLSDKSPNAVLKENLVVAGLWEPSNAGFFMLTPGEGEYEHITDIIHTREEKVKDIAGVKFDEVEGWGHVIEEGDEWHGRKESGRNWTFHFAFSDQGLLYHWVKYVKKSVSIVYYDRVENWSEGPDGKARLEHELVAPLANYSRPMIRKEVACKKFLCDYLHFSGTMKPWLRRPPEDLSEETALEKGEYLWWYQLQQLDAEIGLGLDFEKWIPGQRPALGLYATWRDMNKSIEKSQALRQSENRASSQ